jgi:hypothetical protein
MNKSVLKTGLLGLIVVLGAGLRRLFTRNRHPRKMHYPAGLACLVHTVR